MTIAPTSHIYKTQITKLNPIDKIISPTITNCILNFHVCQKLDVPRHSITQDAKRHIYGFELIQNSTTIRQRRIL